MMYSSLKIRYGKIIILTGMNLFFLSSCGESEEVKNCKIHYCDLEKLKVNLKQGVSVQHEIDEKKILLESTIQTAIETGHSDINEILKNCDCK